MKSIYSKSHFLFIALFVAGVLYSGYVLYSLPAELEKASGKIDLNAIHEVQPVINKTYLVVGLTLLLGVIVLIQFLYQLNTVKSTDVSGSAEKKVDERESQADHLADSEKDDSSKEVRQILDGAKNIKDEKEKYEKILSKLCMNIEASQGILYKVKKEKNKRYIEMLTSFAFSLPDSEILTYEFGEGLAGQVAKEGKKINIDSIPDGYINIISGLGSASPNHLVIYPIKEGGNVVAIAEIASFKEITESDEKLISEVLKIESENSKPEKSVASPTTKKAKEEAKDKKGEKKK